MRRSSTHLAILVWLRGHAAFLIFGFFCMGPATIFLSIIALLVSLPALIIYLLLLPLIGRLNRWPLRLTLLLLATLLVTDISYRLADASNDTSYWGLGDMQTLYFAAMSSTLIATLSIGNGLRSARQ